MDYYGDHDPYAAEWMKRLIAAGELPPGDVDRRGIEEVQGDELRRYRHVHLFAGIGGWPFALRLAGWDPAWPVWTGSCPCQPFSSAGRQEGTADERHLWPEMFRLIRECRPPVVFGEQVSSGLGREWFDGQEGLRRVRDAQAVLRVLREQQGPFAEAVQGLHLPGRTRAQGQADAGAPQAGFSSIQEEAAGESALRGGEEPGEREGDGLRPGRRGHRDTPGDDRRRDMSPDRHPIQPGRRENLGQPLAGQDRLIEGIHSGQCADSPLLRQRDGEFVGREQDRGDFPGDYGAEAEAVRQFARTVGALVETADRYPEFAGVRSDLESLGYACGAADLPAGGVGAPHVRQRLFWVAIAPGGGFGRHRGEAGSEGGQGRAEPCQEPAHGGGTGGVAVAERDGGRRGQQERGQDRRAADWRAGAGAATAGVGLGYAPQRGQRADGAAPRSAGHADQPGTAGRVDHADGPGREGRGRDGSAGGGEDGSEGGTAGPVGPAGPTGRMGHADAGGGRQADAQQQGRREKSTPWSDFALVYCRDDKLRRVSTQPGDEPLADGIPSRRADPRMGYLLARLAELGLGAVAARQALRDARRNRVGRLKGYGNAIVPQLAATFLRVVMDILTERGWTP